MGEPDLEQLSIDFLKQLPVHSSQLCSVRLHFIILGQMCFYIPHYSKENKPITFWYFPLIT